MNTFMSIRVERVARVVGVLALATALVLAVFSRVMEHSVTAGQATVARVAVPGAGASMASPDSSAAQFALTLAERLSARRAPTLVMPMRTMPSAAVRAVLGATFAAGVSAHWQDATGIRDLATASSSTIAPRPASLLAAAFAGAVATDTSGAPAGDGAAATSARGAPSPSVSLLVRDVGGVLDSVRASAPWLRVRAARVRAPVMADVVRDGELIARARLAVPAPSVVRAVRVYARPGWEAKFVVAALEEAGWTVEGALTVSPTSSVRIGLPTVPDSSRTAAVVVLDSGVVSSAVLQRFLGQGGGVLLAGEALRDPVFAAWTVARITADRPAIAGALLTDDPLLGVAAFHLVPSPATLVLAREGRDPVMVIARVGSGRVIASGYRGTWHWRMEGRDESADDHRRWWDDLVGTVAMVTESDEAAAPHRRAWPGDAAPRADLLARIGAPSAAPVESARSVGRAWPPLWLLFVIAGAALLTEWALRRLRGAA